MATRSLLQVPRLLPTSRASPPALCMPQGPGQADHPAFANSLHLVCRRVATPFSIIDSALPSDTLARTRLLLGSLGITARSGTLPHRLATSTLGASSSMTTSRTHLYICTDRTIQQLHPAHAHSQRKGPVVADRRSHHFVPKWHRCRLCYPPTGSPRRDRGHRRLSRLPCFLRGLSPTQGSRERR
jgi:hypothetical protein